MEGSLFDLYILPRRFFTVPALVQAALRELQLIVVEKESEARAGEECTEEPVVVRVNTSAQGRRLGKAGNSGEIRSEGSLNKTLRSGSGSGTWKQLQKRSSQNLKSIGQIFK